MIEPIPHVAHSDTSRAAAVSMEESAGTLRSKVLGALNGHYYSGCTDEELQDYLEMPANTERPRRRELQLRGLIRDSGLRRKTRSGRLAVVWVVA